MAASTDEKLWRYSSLARLWSWSLIVVAGLLLLLSVAIQGGADEGLGGRWFATLLGVTGLTGVVLFPLFRIWLRRAALPSGGGSSSRPGARPGSLAAAAQSTTAFAGSLGSTATGSSAPGTASQAA